MNYFINKPFTIENLRFFLGEFKCQRCKYPCCTIIHDGIVLLPDEVERLAEIKSISKKQFKERYTFTKDGKRLMITPCPFYDPEINCTIHNQKPKVCQQFPFNQTYHKNGIDWMTVNVDCPGGKIIGEKYGIIPESVGVKV